MAIVANVNNPLISGHNMDQLLCRYDQHTVIPTAIIHRYVTLIIFTGHKDTIRKQFIQPSSSSCVLTSDTCHTSPRHEDLPVCPQCQYSWGGTHDAPSPFLSGKTSPHTPPSSPELL